MQAGLIGILAVMAFMILYYRLPGVLASGALCDLHRDHHDALQARAGIGPVTITLSGIAGFVLSVGMAVDANILVFERMKEELRAGRALALRHRARLRPRLVLDPRQQRLDAHHLRHPLVVRRPVRRAALVKGFALTLGIGVLVSMFSAIVVTRTFLRLLVGTPVARNMRSSRRTSGSRPA